MDESLDDLDGFPNLLAIDTGVQQNVEKEFSTFGSNP